MSCINYSSCMQPVEWCNCNSRLILQQVLWPSSALLSKFYVIPMQHTLDSMVFLHTISGDLPESSNVWPRAGSRFSWIVDLPESSNIWPRAGSGFSWILDLPKSSTDDSVVKKFFFDQSIKIDLGTHLTTSGLILIEELFFFFFSRSFCIHILNNLEKKKKNKKSNPQLKQSGTKKKKNYHNTRKTFRY